jgi:putative glutamine amidotransferase
MQMLSVATGAMLVTHVPEEYGETVAHRLDHPRRPIPHDVQVEPESRLAQVAGKTAITVVSWHHQAVKKIPDCWRVVAYAADGLVEALEHQYHPWMLTVQWHPELSPEDPVHQRLFQGLVKAASKVSDVVGVSKEEQFSEEQVERKVFATRSATSTAENIGIEKSQEIR